MYTCDFPDDEIGRILYINIFHFFFADYVINDVAKILRLLHLKDLRDLQSVINTAIIEVQSKTANPKTDSRLGKVGFKG